MAARATKRRSARQLAERKHSIYYEPDSDELDVGESDEDDGEADFQPEPQRLAKKRKLDRRAKPRTRAAAESRRRSANLGRLRKDRVEGGKQKKKIRLAAPLKAKTRKEMKYTGPSDGKTPDWTSLPIEILRDVFVFASQPMLEQTTTGSASAGWLMRAARTCRGLAVPALEAYYQSPYPHNNIQPHYLLELLQMPLEKTYINYHVKVKRLEIDVRRLAYSATGKWRVDLSSIVRLTPQLQQLEVVHPVDTPPYRKVKLQSWYYPNDLFQAMEESGIRLKTWRWNRDMIPTTENTDIYTFMQLAHTSKAFEYLEKLVVCGFNVTDSTGPPHPVADGEVSIVPSLAASVSQLRHLKDLTFTSCDLIMEDFLDHIPKNLERLDLSNCLEVTTGMLQRYLTTGGSQLRELVLNHNSAVDLTFLPQLKMLCPKLEVLTVDLTYYSERYNYNDAWPMYDQLLSEDDIPVWPSTLQRLEIVNMQKCTAEAAQNLFRSLVEGARDLPNLRYLVIQAHINVPWRDRAQFRDQWIDRLNKVYLRRSEPPNPFLGSLHQFKLYKQAIADGRTVTGPADIELDAEPSTRRRLSHVRVTPRKAPPEATVYPDPESSAEKPRTAARRSTRVAERIESQQASTAAEDDSSSEEEGASGQEWSDQPEAFIQGLCQVVDIRIDNQRPRENQYTEANFLDTEPSGDEDWHSGAELSDDGYAW
jgi:hypothetical protein